MQESVGKIADALEELAFLLELKGENPFKVRAHENAARILRTVDVPFDDFLDDASAGRIKGIGKHLLEKIVELHRTGKLPVLEKLRKEFPPGLIELTRVPGLGPKKVKQLYTQLRVTNLDGLENACRKGQIATLPHFGDRSQEKILSGIQEMKKYSGRYLLRDALAQAKGIMNYLRELPEVKEISEGGSLRQRRETVRDIDIVVASNRPQMVVKRFVEMPGVNSITAQGGTRAAVVLESGIAVDLRVVKPPEYPAALQYFSGSKEHNTVLRARAIERGWKLNEYGLFEGKKRLRLKSEADIYEKLGLAYIPVEVREEHGEIEFSELCFKQGQTFPKLIELSDIRGILHLHTNYSDGTNTIEEVARAAMALGYSYIGVSDHSQSATYARGLTPAQVKEQHREIDRLNEELKPFRIFKGIESDILVDGRLDYPEEILELFDFVIASVHSRFSLGEAEMTKRIVSAVSNRYTTILGHPTGRLLLQRDPYAVDLLRVIEVAAEVGTAIEFNCNPLRMELDWRHLRRARELGVKIPISPDAHSIEELRYIEDGVGVARKGWLRREDVINTLSADALWEWFQKKRR